MGTQRPGPRTNGRLASQNPCSQSPSADQQLRCLDHQHFSDGVQRPHMCLTNPTQHSLDVDGLAFGSIPLPRNKDNGPRVAESLPSLPQPTHYEQQWSVASYSSLDIPHRQPPTQFTPLPRPVSYSHHSEQEPAAPSPSTPLNHSQLPQLAAATNAAPVASVPATTPPPLQVPYPGKVCSICLTSFVWKNTADRCFGCCGNKAGPKKLAAVIERAARGIDSCSTCYSEADRGDNKLCTICYERQKGKTQRQKEKQRARKAREAAEAIFKGLGISFDPAVESLGVVIPSVQMPDMETPDIPASTT